MSDESFDPLLLELHLGRLGAAERTALEARLAADPALAAQHAALTSALRALDAQRRVVAPADLVGRICARVRAAGKPARLLRPRDELTEAAESAGGFVIRLSNLREIVAAAAMIVLMVGLGVPSLLHMRQRGMRMGCTANLAALGQGLQQYAQTFNAGFPFTGWNARLNSWQPSTDPNVVTVPNRRHVYPLLRLAFVREPRIFVCPSRGGVPMPKEHIAACEDFLESDNVSYSYFNMAGARPSLHDNPRLPIMADENPLFEDGVPLLSFGDPANQNSRAHRGGGQNILTLDGHVRWTRTPLCGIDGDNIWTLDGVQEYTGREGPASPADAHLIK